MSEEGINKMGYIYNEIAHSIEDNYSYTQQHE